ncbi:MAG: hypothetical protein KJ882_02130 [Proteobacteria bacterium]|nr:hypothetical protein [Pseudomonadota bacterium]MBU4034858.1 hypothetical protein [Pseudomonadota bacterium]
MHILGKWGKKQDQSMYSTCLDRLRLFCDEHVTTMKNSDYKIHYEGVIFNRIPEDLLKKYNHFDDAYGLFAYVKIDIKEERIVIGTDKLGFNPLFYSLGEHGIYFSTSLTLLKYEIKNPSIDYEAWDEILNIGDIIGRKTTVKEIKRLEPGTRIHISNERITFERFWEPEVENINKADDYINNNNKLLAEALELTKNAQPQKVILLSGGLDSRRIGVAAHSIGLPFYFATQAHYENLIEMGIAKKIAAVLNRNLEIFSAPPASVAYNDSLIRDFWLGFETDQHEWIFPLIREIPKNSLVYNGIAGDVAINAAIFREPFYPSLTGIYKDKDVDKIAAMICKKKTKLEIDKKRLNATIFERVRDELMKYPEIPQRLSYFYLLNHTRKNIALMDQLFSIMGHKICYPFLYYPLLVQSLSLHPEDAVKLFYQKACMETLNPNMKNIESTRDGSIKKHSFELAKESHKKELLLINNAKIKSETKNLIKRNKINIQLFEVASLLGINKIAKHFAWRSIPLARMSMFIDWLNDTNGLKFQIEGAEPQFLNKRISV